MRRLPLTRTLPALTVVLLLTAAAPAKEPAEVVWSHPNPARYDVSSIAVLPVVVLDGDTQAANLVEKVLPWKWVPTGHGWLQSSSSRELLREAGGGALLQELAAQVRRSGRVDSLAARRVARVVHTGAFLAVRVDVWQKRERDRTQLRAKPSSTTISLRASLVDSSGTLLWSISGTEVLQETPGRQELGSMGIRPGALGIGLQTVSTAPTFEDVLSKLLARWRPLFLAAAHRAT